MLRSDDLAVGVVGKGKQFHRCQDRTNKCEPEVTLRLKPVQCVRNPSCRIFRREDEPVTPLLP